MNNGVYFYTFAVLHDVPNVCGVCNSKPPIFRYEFCDGEQKPDAAYLKGFCCTCCAHKLLGVLENVGRKEWTREEAALESMLSN